jgi:hypothetical protein
MVDVTRGSNAVSFSQISTTEAVKGYSVKPSLDFVTGVDTVDDKLFRIYPSGSHLSLWASQVENASSILVARSNDCHQKFDECKSLKSSSKDRE